MIPLEKELAHVKAYLELEEARFEERLTVKINVDPDSCGGEQKKRGFGADINSAADRGKRGKTWGNETGAWGGHDNRTF